MYLYFFVLALALAIHVQADYSLSLLSSTEADPESFVANKVNVINGDYCEVVRDLQIIGPDDLVLDRYFNAKDYVTGKENGIFRLLPQRFLIVGQDPNFKTLKIGKEEFQWAFAFTGERSGGILTYSGWKKADGTAKDPLKINLIEDGKGAVNTFAKEISGKTCHYNHLLYLQEKRCEVRLGDGTRRIYKQVSCLPSNILGEELNPLLALKVKNPTYFLLVREHLPSGNCLYFSYDRYGHLTRIEMKAKDKILSWLTFSYHLKDDLPSISIRTSDERELIYYFSYSRKGYLLTSVQGSHTLPCHYEYQNGELVSKRVAKQQVHLTYGEDGKVASIKGPHYFYTFHYLDHCTEVINQSHLKTRYYFDQRKQLCSIERFDEQNKLYRKEQKFWGLSKDNAGLLLAKTIADGNGRIFSYRAFTYDGRGNVNEERLYGNLTGKEEASLQVSEQGKLISENEYDLKTFCYSEDGFNLLTQMGDSKGGRVLYIYQEGTNLLKEQFICNKNEIKKRLFKFYNEDGVCIKEIEDDGSQRKEKEIYGSSVTERHIKEIKPKKHLPGVGLPEVIEEKALDLKERKEILVKKLVNSFDAQGHLLYCDTYDSTGTFAYREERAYQALGEPSYEIDRAGKRIDYTYDTEGRKRSASFLGKHVLYTYNQEGLLIEEKEISDGQERTSFYDYDKEGRKIAIIDYLGGLTSFKYDEFGRLIQVAHPEVMDENEKIIRPTFTYTYDIFGNVITIQDPLGYLIKKCYNLRGSPTHILYPDGSYELFKYDPEGSLHRSLTRDQILTVYEYDYAGRLAYAETSTTAEKGVSSFLASRSYKYNGFRCINEKIDNFVRRYKFDPAGRVIAIVQQLEGKEEKDPENRLTQIYYDSLGREEKKKIWFGPGEEEYSLECSEKDLSGNVIKKSIKNVQGETLIERRFVFDSANRCIEEWMDTPKGAISLFKTSYNAWGETQWMQDASGNQITFIQEKSHHVSGVPLIKKSVINAQGIQTQIEFDLLGRVVSLKKKDSMGTLLTCQENRYDALGNQTMTNYAQVVEGNIVGWQKNCFVFGPMGRLEEERGLVSSLYTYNALGQLTSKTTSGISSLNYLYNKEGRLYKIESFGQKNKEISNRYSYDRRGHIISAHALNGKSIERSYNIFGQVTRETIQDGEGKYHLSFAYDRKGRLTHLTLPDLSQIVYIYDAAFGREVRRLSPQGELLYQHTYQTYNSQGKLLKESLIGYGGEKKQTYSPLGAEIHIQTDFLQEEIGRDEGQKIIQVKREGLLGSFDRQFSYNGRGQLICEQGEKIEEFECDSLDNRIKENQEALIYQDFNQFISFSKGCYSYDHLGILNQKIFQEKKTALASNPLGQITLSGNQTFSYDAFNRLIIQRKGKESPKRFFYLMNQEIGSLNAKGEIEELRIPALIGERLSLKSIALEIKGEVSLPIHDFAGNVAALIDPLTHQIKEHYLYNAFGKEKIIDQQGKQVLESCNPWRFAEKRQIEEWVFFGKRFYDPTSGRFISPDPIGLKDGPNLYAYLHHDPLNDTDAFGLTSEGGPSLPFGLYFFGEVETHCYCEKHRTCKRGGSLHSLPLISYCESFESFCAIPTAGEDFWASNAFEPVFEASKTYDLDLPELPNMAIGFINGIDNSFKQAEESAKYLSKLAGGYNIHAVYNTTHGIHTDLMECAMGLFHIATEPVHQLHKMWNSFFEKAISQSKFLMICHSQGAIHVRNALLDYPKELRDRILVIAIAPGGYIYQESCAQVLHYRAAATRDFIPRIDQAGAKRAKETIIDLPSHPETSLFDHTFTSPTYLKKLKENIDAYIQNQGAFL